MANYNVVAGDNGFGTNAADTFTLSSDLDGDTDFSLVKGRGGADVADFGAVSAGSSTITKNPDGTFTVLIDAGAAKDSFTLSNFETIKFANATLDLATTADAPQWLFVGSTTAEVGAGVPLAPADHAAIIAPATFATWDGATFNDTPTYTDVTISSINGAAPSADVIVVPGVGVATIGAAGDITFKSTASGVAIGSAIPLNVIYSFKDAVGTVHTATVTYNVTLTQATDGNDTFAGTTAIDDIHAGKGDDTLYGQERADSIDGGDGNDKIWGGAKDDSGDVFTGGAGNDTIGGGVGDDLVFGDDAGVDGSDKLYGGVGNDTIYGGADDSRSLIRLVADATGAPADVIWAGEGKDAVYGASGNDTIGGGAGDDNIRGGNGNDVIYGGGGNDNLYGGNGSDKLYGGVGNDTVYGGDGADVIDGGAGNDVIDLYDDDNEVDTVVFAAGFGQDIVNDFVSGEDKLDVSAFNVTSVTVTYEVLNGDNYAVVDLGNGNEILVEDFDGTAGKTLSQSDFIF